MKKLVLSLVAILAFVNMTFAQKNLDKGTIKMELTEITATDPQMAMQLEMMKGSSTEIKFGDGVQATTADMMLSPKNSMRSLQTSEPCSIEYDL